MIQRMVYSLLLTLLLANLLAAQDRRSPGYPAVTATASTERVRFTAPSSVVQIRLEVYDSAGRKLFDNEVRGGNVLDWHLQDGQAARLQDDIYLCAVTVKSVSGRITQKVGAVRIEKATAIMQAFDALQLTTLQAQAIGPVEEDASLTVLNDGDNQTTTVIAHNGEEGLITRGKGALSFSVGDFFSGKDTEQMRLTQEGNLGIGIAHPMVRLDVDGLIRGSQGIVFPDGSIQYSAATKTYGGRSSVPGTFSQPGSSKATGSGQQHIEAAGTGTLNFLAKWAETGGAGTLTNSGIFESNGNVGIGTTSPQFGFEFRGNNSASSFTRDIGTTPVTVPQSVLQLGLTNVASRSVGVGPSFLFFGDNSAGGKSFLGRVSGAWENPAAGAESGAIFFQVRANSADTTASTERMRITAAGNVGIGTTSPVAVLDVQREGSVAETARFTTFGATNEVLGRASAGTRAAPGATPNGRIMLQLGATGHDGSSFVANPKATIQLTASEDWTGSTQGTLIRFNTTASGTTTTNTKMIITDDGSIGIGTVAPTKHLHVFGASDQQIAIESSDPNGRQWTLQSSRGTNNGRFEIVDRTANTSRFSILDTGNVGIGTTAPTARLDVNGDVKVNGAISIAAQTRHLTIHATSFTLVQGAEWSTGGGNIFVANDGNVFSDPMQAGAPVNLPDGAVVTRVRALVEDDDNASGQNIRVQLKRIQFGGSISSDVMADVSTAGAGAPTIITTTSISNATIDNGGFSYFIEASSPGSDNNNFRLFSVVIDYTVTTPLP